MKVHKEAASSPADPTDPSRLQLNPPSLLPENKKAPSPEH